MQYIRILDCKSKSKINIIFSLFFIKSALYSLCLMLSCCNSFIALFIACALLKTNIKKGLFAIYKYMLNINNIDIRPLGLIILFIAFIASYRQILLKYLRPSSIYIIL